MVVDQLSAGLWVFLFLWLVLIAYLVPDGHTLSPGWRRFMLLGLAGVAAFLVGSAGDASGFREAHDGADPPAGLAAGTGLRRPRPGRPVAHRPPVLRGGVRGACPVAAILGRRPAAAVVARLGSDQPAACTDARLGRALRTRRQPVGGRPRPSPWPGSPFPSRIGIAILRYQLFDIQLVLSRTLTYGVLVGRRGRALRAPPVRRQAAARRQHGVGACSPSRSSRSRCSLRTRSCAGGSSGGCTATAPTRRQRCAGWAPASSPPTRSTSSRPITASVADALKVDRVWVAAPGDEASRDPRVTGSRSIHRGELIGDLAVAGAARVAACRRQTPRCSTTSPDMPRSPCARRSWPRSCRPRGRGSSPLARRSASDCAESCTTGSGRPWPRSCSSSRPPGRARGRRRAQRAARGDPRRDQGRHHRGTTRGRRAAPTSHRRGRPGRCDPPTRRVAVDGPARLPRSRARRRCPRCPPPSRSRPSGSPPRP